MILHFITTDEVYELRAVKKCHCSVDATRSHRKDLRSLRESSNHASNLEAHKARSEPAVAVEDTQAFKVNKAICKISR